jgi:hypothetical protein
MKKRYDLSSMEPTAILGAFEALHEAQVAGIRVSICGYEMMFEPPAPISPELRSQLEHREAPIVALLHRKKDGRNALDWHLLYEDCVRIHEREGDLSRDEAEANAFYHCCHVYLGLRPVMLSDGVCPHCSAGEELDPLLPYRDDGWVHEDCESAWSEARQAEAAADDLGPMLDWGPRFSPDRCVQCGEQSDDARYRGEKSGSMKNVGLRCQRRGKPRRG